MRSSRTTRPEDTRPARFGHDFRRPGPALNGDFDRLLGELADARRQYDGMDTASLGQRAELQTRLHELRAELAGLRHSIEDK